MHQNPWSPLYNLSKSGFYSLAMSWAPRMKGQMIRWWDGQMRDYSPMPDNQKFYIKNGNTMNHNLSFSGSGKI